MGSELRVLEHRLDCSNRCVGQMLTVELWVQESTHKPAWRAKRSIERGDGGTGNGSSHIAG